MGLLYINKNLDPLLSSVKYHGSYCLLFEKAVSAWWIGRKDESIFIFNHLLEFDLPDNYINAIKSNVCFSGLNINCI